ncbi:bifunctional Immunoglobulin E-set/Immunoglobulin-like fold/Filamin-ABP280 repeat-like [Babesia duncani]|uniref:Bifunctional Immunoglobulin E-set/Immunoglobulin-like fold/Filamin-ABP280 repeat-like n=1 Tax=Babesia duncani TaxID=323732 RepID=A0AAD9UPW6_9APIC|nr:bifunctional Immunoglobulin E-set/Immunoglobulin-like fold/Filamin-ABP280 repeat-like [Babesia duncani]
MCERRGAPEIFASTCEMFDIEAGRNLNHFGHKRHENEPIVSPIHSRCRGAAFQGGRAGTCIEVGSWPRHLSQGKVILYDTRGFRFEDNNVEISATLSSEAADDDASISSTPVFIKPIEGAFQITYVATIAGAYKLNLKFNDEHVSGRPLVIALILGSPFFIRVHPGEPCAQTSHLSEIGSRDIISRYREFLLEPHDVFGNVISNHIDLDAHCTGEARVDAVNCTPSGMRIVSFQNKPGNSKLHVKIHGQDVCGSPLVLEQVEPLEPVRLPVDPFLLHLNACARAMERVSLLKQEHQRKLEEYQQKQSASLLAYNATRMQLVHTIPAAFVMQEPDVENAQRRIKLQQRHQEIQEQVRKLQLRCQENDNVAKSIANGLVDKLQEAQSVLDYAKESLDLNTRRLDNLLFKTRTHGATAIDYTTVALARQSQARARTLEAAPAPKHPCLSEASPPTKVSTRPDRPNTLAFWLLEGRFRAPKS